MRARVDVCLATSHGGHLELLRSLEAAWDGLSRAWVTPASRQADELARAGERVEAVTNPWRNPFLLARNLVQSARLARRLRPRIVVSAGAGAALPFCVVARLLGARVVWIETMARVGRPSASGRIAYRLADAFLVQWPELKQRLPRAEVCRPALLEQIGERRPGRGTLVATGTHGRPFDRLLRLVDEAVAAGTLPRPVTAQGGVSNYEPAGFELVGELSPAEFRSAVEQSELVVCHGGSGVVSLALRNGRTPLVLPRRREHAEHFDDHQVETTAKLASLGLVLSLDELSVDDAVRRARSGPGPSPAAAQGPPLAARLGELIRERLP